MGRLCEDRMSELAATHKGFAYPRCTAHPPQQLNFFHGHMFVVTPVVPKSLDPPPFFFLRKPARRSDAHAFARGSSESKLAVRVSASLQRQLDDNPVGVTLLKVKHTHTHTHRHLCSFFFLSTFLCLSLSSTRRL